MPAAFVNKWKTLLNKFIKAGYEKGRQDTIINTTRPTGLRVQPGVLIVVQIGISPSALMIGNQLRSQWKYINVISLLRRLE